MRFSSSDMHLPDPALLLALLLMGGTAAAAPAATVPCALVAPRVEPAAGRVQFEITLDCGAQAHPAKPFPAGAEVHVGLTLYAGADVKSDPLNSTDNFQGRDLDAPEEVRTALGRGTQSRTTGAGGAPKWIVLRDESAASYDVTPKGMRVGPPGSRTTLRFDVDDKAIVGMQHFVFAAWRASQRVPCKKNDKYARSGCKRDGYVLGGDGVDPLGAYPGLEVNRFEHPSGAEWTSERWIAERFR